MMNTDRFFESKLDLKKRFGDEYPKSREELTFRFLFCFADYVPGVNNEEDYESEEEYEQARIASERWKYFRELRVAREAVRNNGEAGKPAWEEYLGWVTENYFPEFSV